MDPRHNSFDVDQELFFKAKDFLTAPNWESGKKVSEEWGRGGIMKYMNGRVTALIAISFFFRVKPDATWEV